MVPVTAEDRRVAAGEAELSRADLDRVLAPIAPEMTQLGAGMDRFISSLYGDFFPEARKLAAGGKRLRGAVCIAATKLLAVDRKAIDRAIAVAVDIEGIHLASLLHDDIIDGATERRGIATLHERYGRTGAILAGDLVYVKIFRHLLDFRDDELIRAVTDGTADMVEGETLETVSATLGLEPSLDDYYRCIGKKTASFFRAAAIAGARVGASATSGTSHAEDVVSLGRYGYGLGMVFQIIDDILDWTAEPESFGKNLLSDIKNRKLTLPLLLFIDDDPAAARASIRLAVGGDVTPLSSELARRGYLQRARHSAEKYALSGREALRKVNGETGVLDEILDFSLNRYY